MLVQKKKNKKIIISHIADVDGVSSVILAKLYYGDIDYYLVEFAELEDALKELLTTGQYKDYDEIFVTDVSFRNSTLKLVDENSELKGKIRHFDHHMTEMDNAKKYSFVNEVNTKDGELVCGTTLFYDYIKDDFKYKSEFLDKYLEAVRSYDTGGPFCGNQYGNDLTTIFDIIGPNAFINKFVNGIKEGKDPLTEDDITMINREYQKVADYIALCDASLVKIGLNGHKVGVSISEQYRSSVGNVLSRKYKDELDYILIINFPRGQFSFRTVKDNVNVGEIAKSLTKEGGGHIKAAGMPINSDTLFILDLVKESLMEKEKIKSLNNNSN